MNNSKQAYCTTDATYMYAEKLCIFSKNLNYILYLFQVEHGQWNFKLANQCRLQLFAYMCLGSREHSTLVVLKKQFTPRLEDLKPEVLQSQFE